MKLQDLICIWTFCFLLNSYLSMSTISNSSESAKIWKYKHKTSVKEVYTSKDKSAWLKITQKSYPFKNMLFVISKN